MHLHTRARIYILNVFAPLVHAPCKKVTREILNLYAFARPYATVVAVQNERNRRTSVRRADLSSPVAETTKERSILESFTIDRNRANVLSKPAKRF